MAQEVIEIGLTVPYEIEIDSNDINMDNFECFFSIETNYARFSLPLKRKGKDYILKVPQELSLIGNEIHDYKIYVTQENAIFVASEGKVKVISASKESFKVKIKTDKTSGIHQDKRDIEQVPPETNPAPKNIKKEGIEKVETSQPLDLSSELRSTGEEIKRESLKEYKREVIKANRQGGGIGRSLQEILAEKAAQKEKLSRKEEINARVRQLLGEMKQKP